MSPSFSGTCLPPSISLLPVGQIISSSEEQIGLALKNLKALYCPLRLPGIILTPVLRRRNIPPASTPLPVDSGYASQDEGEDEDGDDDTVAVEEMTAVLRADPFERAFTSRWLTSLISRIEDMEFSAEVKNRIADDTAFILASFCDSANHDDKDQGLTRTFSFSTPSGREIKVVLNDEPLSGTDHTDVGLQSWGASVILSSMLCANPARFGLTRTACLPAQQRRHILELGAGTGLVSLALAKLINKELETTNDSMTTITATDYHPTVLSNCTDNIDTNFPPCSSSAKINLDTLILDWTSPPPQLQSSANLLFASDVVYASDHAIWLHKCAAHLLSPEGTFWLLATIRANGKFEAISQTVEAAFTREECSEVDKRLRILEKETVERRRGVGRGDEVGYMLYKIGWSGLYSVD